MYRDGTLHNDVNVECTGTEHYIMMWRWKVQGQNIIHVSIHFKSNKVIFNLKITKPNKRDQLKDQQRISNKLIQCYLNCHFQILNI